MNLIGLEIAGGMVMPLELTILLSVDLMGGDCEEFNAKYPNCNVVNPYYIGDGVCNGKAYNTVECGFEEGDCEEFDAKYPECNVDNSSWIGDGQCDGGAYNTRI